MARAAGVVAMGGYNTFCEILSFDKPAPDRAAHRAAAGAVHPRPARPPSSGSSRCWPTTMTRDPRTMAAALLQLAQQPPPSAVVDPRAARRHGQRQPAGAEVARRRARPVAGAPERRAATHEPARLELAAGARVAFVLKGYPRLSETFIAQEILALEQRGLGID